MRLEDPCHDTRGRSTNPTKTRDRNIRHYNSEREGASIAEVRSDQVPRASPVTKVNS